MDPDRLLKEIADAGTLEEIKELSKILHSWLIRGGFQPNWHDQPLGSYRYFNWVNNIYKPELEPVEPPKGPPLPTRALSNALVEWNRQQRQRKVARERRYCDF